MNVRKVPKMKEVKSFVKKITLATCFLTFVAFIITKDFVRDIAGQFIRQEYKLMERRNSTFMELSFDPNQLWMKRNFTEVPVFKPFEDDDFFKTFDIDWRHQDDQFPVFPPFEHFNFTTPDLEPVPAPKPVPVPEKPVHHHAKPAHHKHHHKTHHQIARQGFDFDMQNMTQEEALNTLDLLIGFCMVLAAFWFVICYGLQQGLFIFAIKKVMQAQRILENHFMGPELAQTNMSGNAIHYISVPPNQVQPRHVQVNQTGHIPVV